YARDAKRHDRARVMMTDGMHVGTRLIDAAMNDALAIEKPGRRHDRLRVEREFQDVTRLDQFRAAGARQQISPGIGRMAHADMAEAIEHALMCKDAICKGKFVACFVESRHQIPPGRITFRHCCLRPDSVMGCPSCAAASRVIADTISCSIGFQTSSMCLRKSGLRPSLTRLSHSVNSLTLSEVIGSLWGGNDRTQGDCHRWRDWRFDDRARAVEARYRR